MDFLKENNVGLKLALITTDASKRLKIMVKFKETVVLIGLYKCYAPKAFKYVIKQSFKTNVYCFRALKEHRNF